MKYIFDGTFVFTYEYEKVFFFVTGKGFFQTKTMKDIAVWDINQPVFVESEEKAIEKYKTFVKWITSAIPPYARDWRSDYNVIDKAVNVWIVKHDLETLKNRMNSDDFLAYCRQELIDPKEIIS